MSIFDLQEPPPLVLPARTAGRLRRHYPAALTVQCLLAPSTIFANFLLQVCNKTASLRARWEFAGIKAQAGRACARPRELRLEQNADGDHRDVRLPNTRRARVKSPCGEPQRTAPTGLSKTGQVAYAPARGAAWGAGSAQSRREFPSSHLRRTSLTSSQPTTSPAGSRPSRASRRMNTSAYPDRVSLRASLSIHSTKCRD
jgi:hypothetical protein